MNRIVISNQQYQNQQITLNPEQQHYLKRVLRLKKGDRFIALNGQGSAWLVELQETTGVVISPWEQSTELNIKVTLAVALPKGNAFEEIIRPCTEIGAFEIIPVISDRTLAQPSGHKIERWRKIATEAAEQSEREIVPQVRQPQSLGEVLEEFSHENGYICVTRQETKHLLKCLQEKPTIEKIIIVTGPEGGWTTVELEKALICGFEGVTLGSRILRAVTAPMVALSIVAAFAENQPENQLC